MFESVLLNQDSGWKYYDAVAFSPDPSLTVTCFTDGDEERARHKGKGRGRHKDSRFPRSHYKTRTNFVQ